MKFHTNNYLFKNLFLFSQTKGYSIISDSIDLYVFGLTEFFYYSENYFINLS